MGLLNLKPEPDPGTLYAEGAKIREKIFLEHYRALMDSAMQFTRGQRERAEDLVHDAFVQFQVKAVDIESIDNIRSYLSGILRNLHLLQLRRAARYPMQQLSLLDHDSADMGLRAQSPIDQLQSADLLVRACYFVCQRKETSVPASVLILRFFHGYYTDEVCRITGVQRRQVNKWLSRGRTETKEYIAKPYLLYAAEPSAPGVPTHSPRIFLAHLRRLIFGSCTTPCAILETSEDVALAPVLAHLVSCPECLERRSRGLGLPNFNDRMMDDISSRSDATTGGTNGVESQGPLSRRRRRNEDATRLRRAYRDHMREIFEHRPAELSIVFDGETHATLLLNASQNTLNLSLERKQCPDSIAILSEQQVCLLMLDRMDIECSERKVFLLPLSRGRSLEVIVVPEFRGPSIQIAYCDPELADARCSMEPEAAANTVVESAAAATAKGDKRRSSFIRQWRRPFFKFKIPDMNPTLATALVLVTAAWVLLVVGLQQQQRHTTVTDLLQRATAADWSSRTTTDPGVIYQRVAIRTSRRTVERTIYRDGKGIRRARGRPLSADEEQLWKRLANAGVAWDAPLSAADYASWRQRSGLTKDALSRTGKHLLTLVTTPVREGPVLKESLTVRDSDLHAIQRTVELRDTGTIEIAELTYDVLPWAAVNQDWFEPLSGPSSTDAPGIFSISGRHVPQVLSDLEIEESDLEVRMALHQLRADTGERIRISRGTNGVEVKGVVDTDVRKRELVTRLALVAHVAISILSVEEINSHPGTGSPFDNRQPIHVYSVEAQASPLEDYLREENLPVDRLAAISHGLLDGGLKIQQAEVHFSELQPRFNTSDRLPANLRAQLALLLHSYLDAIRAGLDANEQILQSLDFDDATSGDTPPESISSGEEMEEEIHRYQQLCRELISGGNGQSRPAAAIVNELTRASARIRACLDKMSAAVPEISNR
jgi:RNA polymerase sigma factor (sigma-70 family)